MKRIGSILIGMICLSVMLGGCGQKPNNNALSTIPDKERNTKQSNKEDNSIGKAKEVQKQQSNNNYVDIDHLESIFNSPKAFTKNKEVKEDFDGDGKTDTLIINDESTGDGIKEPLFTKASFTVNGSIKYDLSGFDSINDAGVIIINPSTGQKGFYVSSKYANDYIVVIAYKVANNKIEEVKRVSKQVIG